MRKVGGLIPSRSCTNLDYVTGAWGVLPCKGLGITSSQVDQLSLTPLSVDDCGRLQLGVARWASAVALLQVVDN